MSEPTRTRSADGIRVDRTDFDHVSDTPFALLRLLGRGALSNAASQTLTLSSAAALKGRGLVFFGFVVSRVDAQNLIVSSGSALCDVVLPDSSLSYGQIASSGAADKAIVMAGAQQLRGVWARFVFSSGVQDRRARWTDADEEQVFLHDTRDVMDFEAALGVDIDTPPAGGGWFKVAEVDYTGGAVGVDDVTDCRQLFFEGDAENAYALPTANRSTDRGANGCASLFDFAMLVANRLAEVGGRAWYAAPGMAENVRSASSAITVGVSGTAVAGSVHRLVASPIAVGDLEDLLTDPSASSSDDGRTVVEFVPGNDLLLVSLNVDTGSASPSLSPTTRRHVRGPVKFTRSAGANELLEVKGPYTFEGVQFIAGSAGTSLLQVDPGAGAKVVFREVTFGVAGFGAECLELVSGDVQFIGCTFSSSLTTGNLVRVNGSARVHFTGCEFTGGAYGISVAKDPGLVLVEGCHFDTIDTDAVVGDADQDILVLGCTYSAIGGLAVNLSASGGRPALKLAAGGTIGVDTEASSAVASPGVLAGGSLWGLNRRIYLDDTSQTTPMTLAADVDGDSRATFTGYARDASRIHARFGVLHTDALRLVFGDPADGIGIGPALSYSNVGLGGSRITATRYTAFGVATTDVALAADQIYLGRDATQGMARLHRNITPKGWIKIEMVNGQVPGITQSWADRIAREVTGAAFGVGVTHEFQIGRVGGSGTAIGFDYTVTATVCAGTGGPEPNDDERMSFQIKERDDDGFLILPQLIANDGTVTNPTGVDWNNVDGVPDYIIEIHINGIVNTAQFTNGGGDSY